MTSFPHRLLKCLTPAHPPRSQLVVADIQISRQVERSLAKCDEARRVTSISSGLKNIHDLERNFPSRKKIDAPNQVAAVFEIRENESLASGIISSNDQMSGLSIDRSMGVWKGSGREGVKSIIQPRAQSSPPASSATDSGPQVTGA